MSRTAESSQIQHQLTHKPMEDQAALAAQFRKQLEEERKKSGRTEQTSDVGIRDDGEPQNRGRHHVSGKARPREDKEERVQHPYKGRHIDISL